jgi:succinate-semialdehyde dehydrogenase / glutarate-semialdehyde dehydrogenase
MSSPYLTMNRSAFDVGSQLKSLGLLAFHKPNDPQALVVTNPADGSEIARICQTSSQQASHAIEKSEAAHKSWRSKTAISRGDLLNRWCHLIRQHAHDLAAVVTAEQGKPLAEALSEVEYAAAYVQWYSQEANRAYGDVIPAHRENFHLQVYREPVGVCAAITPWNFPLAMITRKVAPALAAGCSILVKPSALTPLSALALSNLAIQAGLPPEGFQVVVADDTHSVEIGKLFCESTIVRKLSFTGSTAIGRILAAQCAGTVKRLSLELGGNAPFLVFDDANIDLAVQGAIASKFRNAGQTCVCTNRFFVHSSVAESFIQKLSDASTQLVVGPGHLATTQIGPLVNSAAANRVRGLVAQSLDSGARLRTDSATSFTASETTNFVKPVVLDAISPNSTITLSEIFGPVATVQIFESDEQAVVMANNTPYGLASYVFSESSRRLRSVASALQYGMVGLNTGLISTEVAPFGGIKQSGYGREGGREGLYEYLASKYVCEAS